MADTRIWGYHPTKGAKLFDAGPLPKGWEDSPAKFAKADEPAEAKPAKE